MTKYQPMRISTLTNQLFFGGGANKLIECGIYCDLDCLLTPKNLKDRIPPTYDKPLAEFLRSQIQQGQPVILISSKGLADKMSLVRSTGLGEFLLGSEAACDNLSNHPFINLPSYHLKSTPLYITEKGRALCLTGECACFISDQKKWAVPSEHHLGSKDIEQMKELFPRVQKACLQKSVAGQHCTCK